MLVPLGLVSLLATNFLVLAAPSSYKVKESVIPPRGWSRTQRAPADHIIELRVALPQSNFETLEAHLYEISNPHHERYGQHLTKEQVEELVAPSAASLEHVDKWVKSHGCDPSSISHSPAKDWVIIKVPISVAENMLSTEYHVWEHEDGDSIVRTTSYSLPDYLHEHIELVQPTTIFARFKRQGSTIHDFGPAIENARFASGTIDSGYGTTVDASCNATITIKCLQQLYNAVGYSPKSAKKQSFGITSYLEEFVNNKDLQQFYADQRPDAVGSNYTLVSVAGGLNNQSYEEVGVEANLDSQFGFGLTYPIPAVAYTTAGRPPFKPDEGTTENTNEPYAVWVDYVLSHPNPPSVISTSYGEAEQTVPEAYARRVCASLAQLGARGVSLLFASGDGGVGDGVSDPNTQQCHTNDGTNRTRFMPLFPAGCPYVTGVGGTTYVPETAVFFSGGGFSDYWPRPWYQALAVGKYLAHELPKGTYDGLYNPKGRGIPDVSAQAWHYRVFAAGRVISVGGTSASTPTFSGFVSLLNDARLSKGLSPLGFLNPFLYTRGVAGLHDITSGNNPGCGTPGFNATKGWDPITGLGTPDFIKLKSLATTLF
jgi:tripeptidyl-peptidase-1